MRPAGRAGHRAGARARRGNQGQGWSGPDRRILRSEKAT